MIPDVGLLCSVTYNKKRELLFPLSMIRGANIGYLADKSNVLQSGWFVPEGFTYKKLLLHLKRIYQESPGIRRYVINI